MSNFASRCRELRSAYGYTLQQIGDLFGYSKQAIYLWEQGEREPSYEDLLKLADFYGVTVDHLLGRPGAERDSDLMKRAKAALSQYLQLREAELLGTTAATRLGIVYRFLAETTPSHFTVNRVGSWLMMTAKGLEKLLGGGADATPVVIHRFSDLTGVPEEWFWMPNPRFYRSQHLLAWEGFIKKAGAANISPAEAEELLDHTDKAKARAPR